MPLVPDQGAVEQLVSAGLWPAFDDRVHPGQLNPTQDDLDAGVGENLLHGRGGSVQYRQGGRFPGSGAGLLVSEEQWVRTRSHTGMTISRWQDVYNLPATIRSIPPRGRAIRGMVDQRS
jgi:hypothetical protein